MSAPVGKLHRYTDPNLDREIANLYRLVQSKQLDERTLDLPRIAKQMKPRLELPPLAREAIWGKANTNPGAVLETGTGGWTVTRLGVGTVRITPTTAFSGPIFAFASVVGTAAESMGVTTPAADDVRFSHPAGEVEFFFWVFA